MDPKSYGEWSAAEIELMKSLIAEHNTNMNNEHTNIVEELQESFPWKEKRQVTDLYKTIIVEMMQTSSRDDEAAMPVDESSMGNMDIVRGHHAEEIGGMKQAEGVLQKQQPTPEKESPRFWTTDEHRSLIS